jgi:putative inorganic carbon (HCO3(-)) transporter
VVAYLAVCALSVVWSDFPLLSLDGFIGKWLEYALLFVIAADLGSRPRTVRWGLPVLAWSSGFTVIEAISQEILGKGVFRGHQLLAYSRMTGPYENPIDLATYLMVAISILLGFWMTLRGLRRWALGAWLLVLIGCLARTEASGAWLGLCVGLATVMLTERRIRWAGLAVLLVLTVAAGAWLRHEGRLQSTFSVTEAGTRDRWAMWQAAIGMIRDRPIVGHGLNTFMANYLAYWVGGERAPRYAHNCYLQVAAETGIIGLAAFLGLLGAVFRHVLGGLRRARDRERLLLVGFLAGLVAFVIQAGLDTNFYSLRQAALFWVMSGLAVGFSEQGRRDVAA